MSKKLRVLAIGDIADNIATLKKFSKKSSIHLINFPRKGDAIFTNSEEDIEFFDSLLVSKQVEKIMKIKNEYDVCLAMSWAGARIAFLAGLNYIMYFVGGDISTPPFIKKSKLSYLNTPQYNLNFIERRFYRKVFDTSILCIGGQIEFDFLKKYRSDSKRLDKVLVDSTFFNENVKPVKRSKKKFTFLSAQRFGLEKGIDIIWEALKLTKSDFEVLQMKWFIQNSKEEEEINKKLIENMPKQVKFIPLVKREELPGYYMYADAILGQMRSGGQGAIERESAFCKKPVVCYTNPEQQIIINNKKVIPPFLPTSKKPIELAKIIDEIVESKEFRENLVEKQHSYVKELCSPEKVVDEWDKIFEGVFEKFGSVNRKITISNLITIQISNIIEKIYYKRKMRKKNIQAWGEGEYNRLMK